MKLTREQRIDLLRREFKKMDTDKDGFVEYNDLLFRLNKNKVSPLGEH